MTESEKKPTTRVEEKVLQFKINLVGAKPPIWRRVQVRESMTLNELHNLIQISMGWTDSHLHLFEVKGRRFSKLSPHAEFGVGEEDSQAVTLQELRLRRKGQRVRYIYDFGDDWLHEVRVEAALALDPDVWYPVCLKGRRACPPEDCGGIYGYHQLLATVADPKHPEHEEMREWLGEAFDPELFDLEETNALLRAAFRVV